MRYRTLALWFLVAAVSALPSTASLADGCFVWKWNKDADIHEPSQKAIILYDEGREDLILQVKYQGSVTDFGWLIPVPARPEIAKASMETFYELSRLVQNREIARDGRKSEDEAGVKVLEYKTVGVYQIATITAANAQALKDWLKQNDFNWPDKGDQVLQHYIGKNWCFVAVRVNVAGAAAAEAEAKLHAGELHPLRISFDTKVCVYPLTISSLNNTEALVHIYMISRDMPWICPDMDFLTPQANLFPTRFSASEITFPTGSAILKDLPRLGNRKWHLIKHSQSFKPSAMKDLTFAPANRKNMTDACEKRLGQWLAGQRSALSTNRAGEEARYYPWVAAYYAPEAFKGIMQALSANPDLSQLAWVGNINWEEAGADPDGVACLLARKWLATYNLEQRQQWCELLCRMKGKSRAGTRLLIEEMTDPKNRHPHLHFYFDELVGRLLRECPDTESINRLAQLYRDIMKTNILRSAPSSHDCLVRTFAETRSPILADVLFVDLDSSPDSIARALVKMGDKRAPEALTRAALRTGYCSIELIKQLLKLDRAAAFSCMIKIMDANPGKRVVNGEAVNLLIAAGLTEEQFAALFARIFQLVRGADSDAVFRRYVEYLRTAALKETEKEKIRLILGNAVKARKQITYVMEPEPVDDLIGKIALRAYE